MTLACRNNIERGGRAEGRLKNANCQRARRDNTRNKSRFSRGAVAVLFAWKGDVFVWYLLRDIFLLSGGEALPVSAAAPHLPMRRINAAVAFLDNVIYGKCSKKEGKGLPSEEEKLMSQPFVWCTPRPKRDQNQRLRADKASTWSHAPTAYNFHLIHKSYWKL